MKVVKTEKNLFEKKRIPHLYIFRSKHIITRCFVIMKVSFVNNGSVERTVGKQSEGKEVADIIIAYQLFNNENEIFTNPLSFNLFFFVSR